MDELFTPIGGGSEYHVKLLAPADVRRLVDRYFRDVTLYGQSLRGNALHTVLKSLDVFNARHRLVRSVRVQRAVAASVMGESRPTGRSSFRFSRRLVRQSPITVVVAANRHC